jgi:hypothetical protein
MAGIRVLPTVLIIGSLLLTCHAATHESAQSDAAADQQTCVLADTASSCSELASRLDQVEGTVSSLAARVAQLEDLLSQKQLHLASAPHQGPAQPSKPLVGMALSWLDHFSAPAAVAITGNITAVHGVLQCPQTFMPR